MKKISVFIIFLGLLLCNSVFSQSLDGHWEMKNLVDPLCTDIMFFNHENFVNICSDLTTGELNILQGKYSVKGSIVTFVPVGKDPYLLTLTWIDPNRFTLKSKSSYSIYARCAKHNITSFNQK